MNDKKDKLDILNSLSSYMIKKKLTDNSLDEILIKEKIDEKIFYKYFPHKIDSLCQFFFETGDKLMLKNLSKIENKEKRVSKKVSSLLKQRIKILDQNKIQATYFIDFLMLRPITLYKIYYQLSNAIWTNLKDESTDFNYYTKRLILLNIYKKSIFYWRESLDMKKVTDFIDRKISSAGKFGKIKKNIIILKNKTKKFNILSKFDFMHKS